MFGWAEFFSLFSNTEAWAVLVIVGIELENAARVEISKRASENAKARGMSEAEWQVRRLCAINAATADFRMAYDPDGEPAPRSEARDAKAKAD